MLETSIVIALIAGIVLIVTLGLKLLYSSKCTEVRCGTCVIKRDVAREQSMRSVISVT